MSILRTGTRTRAGFTAPLGGGQGIRDGLGLRRQFNAREALLPRVLVQGSYYSTSTTSASLSFRPFQPQTSSSWQGDADYSFTYHKRSDLALIVTRNVGDVSNVLISNASPLPFSGINSGGSTSSHHRMFAFLSRIPSSLAKSTVNMNTYTRTGGQSQFNIMSISMEGAATDRVQGANFATAVQANAAPSLTFPEFQPRNGSSLLLYIATIQSGAGGSPYFSTFNAPGLEPAGGTSHTTGGYAIGNTSAGYGAVLIRPYRLAGGLPNLVAPMTCNISSFTTAIMAIVEIEPALDPDLL
jgi:hypothetical protein